ncbi:hypothetical protein D623_10006074 [Myotis brandtii]|uniref:Uncharacterized protein n=1 Tax=Myotis brandtii TaxID=109478 RepID=S7N0W4_MYOBR|nr:hypothetical protein D623_10006074 [Myotis brandtii]
MPFYERVQGYVSCSEVLGNSPSPPMARFITAAAPKNTCCSHRGAASLETCVPSVGPLPSAIHPRLGTQVGYLGAGSPGAGRQALTKVPVHARFPEVLSGSRTPQWLGGH